MSSQAVKSASYLQSEATVDGLSVLALACILTVIAGFHAKNVYQDMFTAGRKTLEFRAHKPNITRSYKVVVYTTLFAIISFAWTLIFTAIQYNFSKSSCNISFSICEKLGFFASRCALYCTYIIRLERTYGSSGFGWNSRTLNIIAALIIVSTIGLFFFVELTIIWYPVEIRGDGSQFPYYCQIISDEPYVTLAGGLILLFDLVCSIASMFAFIIPLNRIRAKMKENNKKAFDSHDRKIRSVGYQYKVLVVVGSTTTLLWIVLLFAQQMFLATLFINIDFLFNAIVILLMASYYPRDKYYERLCYLCICMCGYKGSKGSKGYNSKASTRNINPEQTAALTADTSTIFAHEHLDKLLYAEVDANDDGRIDAEELAAAVNVSVEKAQQIIDEHDVDGDGKMDREEFNSLKQGILDSNKEDKDKEEEAPAAAGGNDTEQNAAVAIEMGQQSDRYTGFGAN